MSHTLNYGKWDHIELSDDESDLHPNIDKDSWFRLKHRTRLEKEEKVEQETKHLKEQNSRSAFRVHQLQVRIDRLNRLVNELQADDEYDDLMALQYELNQLQGDISSRTDRLSELSRKTHLTIDNICHVSNDKSAINQAPDAKSINDGIIPLCDPDTPKPVKPSSSPPSSKPTALPSYVYDGLEVAIKARDERDPNHLAFDSYSSWTSKYASLLEAYSEIYSMDDTFEFVKQHSNILLNDHSQSYLMLSCLEDELNGKRQRSKLVARQGQILTHITDLAKASRQDPRSLISPFFKRLGDSKCRAGFDDALSDYVAKIQARAIDKRNEMKVEAKLQVKAERIKLRQEMVQMGIPVTDMNETVDDDDDDDEVNIVTTTTTTRQQQGSDASSSSSSSGYSLSPKHVLETLPKSMRRAFLSRDGQMLSDAMTAMPIIEAKFYLRRCIDCGLWNENTNADAYEADDKEEKKVDANDALEGVD